MVKCKITRKKNSINYLNLIHSIRYYLQAIASRSGGFLNIDLNTKMYNSNLNGDTSSLIVTETQIINITSTINQEATVFNSVFYFFSKYLFMLIITFNS